MQQREELRKAGKFAQADEIRVELEQRGYIVEDSGTGPVVKHK